MSLASVLAFLAGIGVVVGSIFASTNHPMAFVDLPSIIIVGGGTFVTLFISYELKDALSALKVMLTAFRRHADSESSLKDEIGRIVRWAYIVQKNGLQGLENEITDSLREENPFLAYGADLVVTGYTGAEIKQILEHTLEAQSERDKRPTDAIKKMGGDSPAFGMLGTLIGLIIMLGSMAGDPSAIGPSMAVALITTFYGIILARIVFIPLSTKYPAHLTHRGMSTFTRRTSLEPPSIYPIPGLSSRRVCASREKPRSQAHFFSARAHSTQSEGPTPWRSRPFLRVGAP